MVRSGGRLSQSLEMALAHLRHIPKTNWRTPSGLPCAVDTSRASAIECRLKRLINKTDAVIGSIETSRWPATAAQDGDTTDVPVLQHTLRRVLPECRRYRRRSGRASCHMCRVTADARPAD